MITAAQDIYEALENIDLAHDLTEKALHVTAEGLAWKQISTIRRIDKVAVAGSLLLHGPHPRD